MDKAFNMFEWFNQPSTASALGMTNLMKINNGLNTVDDRVVYMDTSKAETSVVNNTVQTITFNDTTGVITITKVNGTSTTIDTKLEKLAVNFAYNPTTQQLDITLDDGTVQHVDLSSLITQYEFGDSNTVSFTITDGIITAFIPDGSITPEKLQPNYLADITVQAQTAATQAGIAVEASEDAQLYRNQALQYRNEAEAIVGFDPTTKLNKSNADTAIDGQVLTSNGDGTYSFQDPTGGDSDTANSTVTFTENATDVDIASGDTHATLFGKLLKSIKTLRTALADKFDKANIIQTTALNDAAKVPSSAVTYSLAQSVQTLNDNLVKTNYTLEAYKSASVSSTGGQLSVFNKFVTMNGYAVLLSVIPAQSTVIIFTLPPALRPNISILVACTFYSGTTMRGAFGIISPEGTVTIYNRSEDTSLTTVAFQASYNIA